MRGKFTSLGMLVFLLAVSALCAALNRPPAPLPASAPADEFSAERAMAHEFAIAQKPHPMGSAEHDRVREYIFSELARLGLAPQIQRTTGVTERYQVAGSVENIVARLPGTDGRSDAVLLAAHYDSVAAGPGAGDDGAGVAALLETLRALRASPTLQHDVIFLVTDGEEDGLLGASAFTVEHPWARDARVALNFEARGNAGVSQMFETSAGNASLVSALAHSAPHPGGSSLTYEIYKHMPNDTDMTVLKKYGAAGLNFAFIGHWEAYHTPLDNPQQLDRGSLQQHGEAALFLARHFGNADFSQLQARDATYFSIPGITFLSYPSSWTWPLVLLALALTAIAFARLVFLRGADAGGTSALSVLYGLGANFLVMLLLMVVALAFLKLVSWLHLRRLPEGDLLQNTWYLLSLAALCAALWTAPFCWLRKKLGAPALSLGGALLLLLVTLAVAKWLPGGNYAFVWPLLALQGAMDFSAPEGREAPSLAGAIVLCLLSLPALFLLLPLFQGFYQALGLTTVGASLLALLIALLCIALAPILEALLATLRIFLPIIALTFSIIFFLAGAAATHYTAAHPKPSIMAYALDADSGKAFWASSAKRVDSWTEQYVGNSPARGKLTGFYPDWLPIEFSRHDASALSLLGPAVRLVEATVAGDARTLLLRVTSPRRGRVLSLSAPENEILASWVNGKKLGDPKQARWNPAGKWSLSYANPPAEGIELKLVVKGSAPLNLQIVDRSPGLPEIPGKTFAPRSADSMPYHSGDETLVRRSFVF